MAINVDDVYKTVLLILNKEQRGYMTPDEFNKIGSQVQREIFEAYFEDLNQQLRVPESDEDYASRVAITDEKIAEFKTFSSATHAQKGQFTLPSNLYRLGTVTFEDTQELPIEIQRVTRGQYYNIIRSPLTAPSKALPIYLYENNTIQIYPQEIQNKVNVDYLHKPADIRWGYYEGTLGQYLYDSRVYDTGSLRILNALLPNAYGQQITAGTYEGVAVTTSSQGTGAKLDMVVTGSGTVTLSASNVTFSVSESDESKGYAATNTITIPAGAVGSLNSSIVFTLAQDDLIPDTTQGHIAFTLHNSEFAEVVLKVLLYAGVVIRDPQVVQVAAQQVKQQEINEKS
jgi:hypothetical protein